MSTIRIARASRWTVEEGLPSSTLLPVQLRGSAGRLGRMVAHVVEAIVSPGAVDPGTIPLVIGTARGDLEQAIALVEDRVVESPAGSVVGPGFAEVAALLDRALARTVPTTVVSAGPHTVAMTLLEACLRLGPGVPEVLAVLADAAVPIALGLSPHDGLAVALHLSTTQGGTAVELPRRLDRPPAPINVPLPLQGNPCAAALALADPALGLRTTIRLDPPGIEASAGAWCVDLREPA